jgi:hypothetical protein
MESNWRIYNETNIIVHNGEQWNKEYKFTKIYDRDVHYHLYSLIFI